MSNIWPVTLPQSPLIAGFLENPPTTTVRTSMDAGPAKVRRRYTAAVRPLETGILLTAAQLETFDAFYNDTLDGGALSFEWTHPRTGTTATMRIVETPEYASNGLHWNVRLKLEILP